MLLEKLVVMTEPLNLEAQRLELSYTGLTAALVSYRRVSSASRRTHSMCVRACVCTEGSFSS